MNIKFNYNAVAYCEEHGRFNWPIKGCPTCLIKNHADKNNESNEGNDDNVDTDEDGEL